MHPCGFRGVVILSERDVGRCSVACQIDGDRMVMFGGVGKTRERAVMTVLKSVFGPHLKKGTFVFIGFSLPFSFPRYRAAFTPV